MNYWIKKLLFSYLAAEFSTYAFKHSFRTFSYLIFEPKTFSSQQNDFIEKTKIFYLTNVILFIIGANIIYFIDNILIITSCYFILYLSYLLFVLFTRYVRKEILLIDWQNDDVLFVQDLNELLILSFGFVCLIILIYLILDKYGIIKKFSNLFKKKEISK